MGKRCSRGYARLPSPGTPGNFNTGTRLPSPRRPWSLHPSTRLPAPRSRSNWNVSTHGNGGQVSGNGGQVRGNLPASATHAGIEAVCCTRRWQAGGGQVARHSVYQASQQPGQWRAGIAECENKAFLEFVFSLRPLQ